VAPEKSATPVSACHGGLLLALSLGLDEHHFDPHFTEPMAALLLLHYGAEESKPKEGTFACGAPSDYGMMTLLLTDEHAGLQIS
jgi:isopenicillin N synthase-like dioxygenase